MALITGPLPLECRNYESVLSVVSLFPEPAEDLLKDAGCDTCIHFTSGICDINSPDIRMGY